MQPSTTVSAQSCPASCERHQSSRDIKVPACNIWICRVARNRSGRWLLLALLLALPGEVSAINMGSLFAPAFAGDGQTANWRIINANEARKKPWTAIGNVLIPGNSGYCSAVLVAPRIVLTANHCLYAADYSKRDSKGNPGRQLMDARRFAFFGGVHDATFVDEIPVEQAITGGWTPHSNEVNKDWAILILKRPASSEIEPIAFRSYTPAATAAWTNKLLLAAYPQGSFAFSAVLRFSFNCSILNAASPDIMSHDCPSQDGSSGAPILVEEDGELSVIGIHSSSQLANSRFKTGVSVNSFLPQLQDALSRFN